HGYTASGLPSAPWTLGGSAPAGANRSTTHDMSIWLRAVRDGSAPGAGAAEPRTDFDGGDRIGCARMTHKNRTPHTTQQHSATGGYRSFLGFAPGSEAGIIVLADSAHSVDAAASIISKTGARS